MTSPGPVAKSNGTVQDYLDSTEQQLAELGRKVVREMRHAGTGNPGLAVGTTWTLYDNSANPGNPLVREDLSGTGLGLPWIPIPTVSVISIPQTNSAAYAVAASSMGFRKTSPYCTVALYGQTQAGAVGNVRITINGTPAGAVLAVAATSTVGSVQDIALPGAIGDTVTINVEVQVTNATGTIGAVFTATQRGTP